MDENKAKEEIRGNLRSSRKGIPQSIFLQYSKTIIDHFYDQEEYQNANTIHCYVSMNERREVNTQPLIREMLSNNKGVVVPVTQFEDQSLQHIKLNAFSDLETNKWGVLEPRRGEEYQTSDIDLVIVPMVGGDEHAHRIGYGGGFYDRFLQNIRVRTIGFCFEQNIVSSLPTEPFDVPLDKIITEERIINRQD